MKECKKCGATKALDDFYRHPGNRDGRQGKCKECAKAAVRANYRKRRNAKREYERARQQKPERRRKKLEYQRQYRERYPEKTRARARVWKAIRDGRLIRQPCEHCGDELAQAHHPDYSKPLEVMWLCVTCHYKEHGRSVL